MEDQPGEHYTVPDGDDELMSPLMTKNRYLSRPCLLVLVLFSLGGYPEGYASSGTAEGRPRIVAFGDSLTAGLGVAREEAYPAQLQRRLEELGFQYHVINAGVSGETTAGGLRRVSWVLSAKPEIVILELGANDGLRGLGLDQTKENLAAIIRQLLQANVTVILAGMKLPPNYGEEYTKQFEAIYPALATQYHLPLIPFFLEGVAARPTLNQADGIHPTGEGYKIVVEQVIKVLIPVLEDHRRKTRKTSSSLPARSPQASFPSAGNYQVRYLAWFPLLLLERGKGTGGCSSLRGNQDFLKKVS